MPTYKNKNFLKIFKFRIKAFSRQFVFDRLLVFLVVLVCSSIFYYSKKWVKETVLSFVKKKKLN